jgi:serine O-acetyltransferase
MIFEFISLFIRLLKTSDPSKKFRTELDLMFWGTEHSRCIRKFFQRRIFYKYNCEVSHQAIIHPTVVFGHPSGVIIGSNSIIEKGCKIYQQVTLGANVLGNNAMPKIQENVTICAGAKVIGGVIIGENSIVGANAVVTKNVAENMVAIGANKFQCRKR